MILVKRERRIILLNKILLGLNKNLTKIIKTFIFFWLLLCVYRLIFIWGMSEYLSAGSGHNLILTAIYSGAKLSLQTAGGLTLCMLIGFIAETIWHRLKYFRYICSFVILFITTLLFVARFPFYQQFHYRYHNNTARCPHHKISLKW